MPEGNSFWQDKQNDDHEKQKGGFRHGKEHRRVANNLSQTDVAKVLHCSQVAYGMYELGKRRISVENLVKLAKYYHVSMDYLAGLCDQA